MFNLLKSKLLSAPVLAHNDPAKPKELRIDACGYGFGAVLLHEDNNKWHPVAYISRGLTKAEKNYTITELEALAVVWSLNYLRHLIYGTKIRIVTDHHALCYMKTLKSPTGRLARWAIKLSEYDYDIIHKPGRKHNDADCLSRFRVQPANSTDEEESAEVPTYLLTYDSIQNEQRKDPVLQKIIQILENPDDLRFSMAQRRKTNQYKIKNGVLYRNNTTKDGLEDLLVIPTHLRYEILYSHR